MNRAFNQNSPIKQVWLFLFGSMRKNRRTVVRTTTTSTRQGAQSQKQVTSHSLASVNLLRDFIFDGYVTPHNSLKEQTQMPKEEKTSATKTAKAKSERNSFSAGYLTPCEDAFCCTLG